MRRILRVAITALKSSGYRRALNSLMAHAKELGELKRVLRQTISALRRTGMRRAWNSWAAAKVRRQCSVAVGRRVMLRGCTRALNSWIAHAKVSRELRRILLSAIGALQSSGCRRALNSWMARAKELAALRRILRVTIRSLQSIGVRRAWNTLAAVKVRWQASMAVGRRVMQRGRTRALNSWMAHAKASVIIQRILRTAIAALQSSGSRRALNSWMAHAKELAELKRVLRVTIHSLQSIGVRRAWNSWSGLKARWQSAVAVGRRVMLRGCTRALNGWIAYNKEAALQLRRLRKGLSVFCGTGMRRAFSSWLAMRASSRQLRACLRSVVGRILHLACSRAMTSWRQNAGVNSTQQKISAVLVSFSPDGRKARRALNSWLSLKRQRSGVVRAVTAWTRWSERRSFNAWTASIAARALARLAMKRGAVSLFHYVRETRRALNSWVEMAQEWSLKQRLLQRGLTTLFPKGRAKRRAVNSWLRWSKQRLELLNAVTSMSAEGRAVRKALNSWAVFLRQRFVQVKSLRALVHHGERAGFNAWIAAAKEHAGVQRKMQRALSVLTPEGRSIRKAMNKWAAVARKGTALVRAAQTIELRGERAGFAGWVFFATAHARMRRVMQRALATLSPRGRAKRRALNSWRFLLERRDTFERAMRALALRGERMGFNAWLAAAAENAIQQRKLQRALSVLTPEGRAIRRALNSWQMLVRVRMGQLRTLKVLALRGERRGFNSWLAAARENAIQQRKLRKALSVLTPEGRAVRKATNSWLLIVRLRLTCVRAMRALSLRGERTGFNAWVACAADNAIQQRKVQRALSVLTPEGRAVRRATNSWLLLVQLRATCVAAIRALALKGERRGFNSWMDALRYRRKERLVLHHALITLSPNGRAVRKAMNSWVAMARLNSRLVRTVKALILRRERFAFSTWTGGFLPLEEKKRTLRRGISALSPIGRAKRKSMNSWRILVGERSHVRRLAAKCLAAMQSGRRHRAWLTWMDRARASARWRRDAAVTIASCRGRICFLLVRRAVKRWIAGLGSESISPISALHKMRWRSARQALSRWMIARYISRVEIVLAEVVQKKARSLSTSMALHKTEMATEVAQLRAELDAARASSQDSAAYARRVTEAAEAEIKLATERAQSATRVVEDQLQEQYDAAELERQAWRLERQELRVQMQQELAVAVEAQRYASVEEGRRAALLDNRDATMARDRTVNALRLELEAAKSSVCRLLVDQADANDSKLRRRMDASPAHRSLVAKGRAEGAGRIVLKSPRACHTFLLKKSVQKLSQNITFATASNRTPSRRLPMSLSPTKSEPESKFSGSLSNLSSASEGPGMFEPSEFHKAKVCSVLLPIFPASGPMKADVFKPYDKVTKSPAHGTLPKWSTSPAVLEKMEKYRAMY